jgi:hypothetical protein
MWGFSDLSPPPPKKKKQKSLCMSSIDSFYVAKMWEFAPQKKVGITHGYFSTNMVAYMVKVKFWRCKKMYLWKKCEKIQYDAYNWLGSSYNITIYFGEIAQVTQACCGRTHPNCINVCQNVPYTEL